jgi:hypothetical protein
MRAEIGSSTALGQIWWSAVPRGQEKLRGLVLPTIPSGQPLRVIERAKAPLQREMVPISSKPRHMREKSISHLMTNAKIVTTQLTTTADTRGFPLKIWKKPWIIPDIANRSVATLPA